VYGIGRFSGLGRGEWLVKPCLRGRFRYCHCHALRGMGIANGNFGDPGDRFVGDFCIRSGAIGRSSLFTISACTAASIFLLQTILNALGTVDIIPLTGVTFPFLSNGGSSMICSWGLLAYIKAADTRQNASFAVRIMRAGGAGNE